MTDATHVEDPASLRLARERSTTSEETKLGEDGNVQLKRSPDGRILEPQPSDDPRDPLNWPMSKKILIFSIMCFGTFVGMASTTANILATPEQAKDWNVSSEKAAYTVSAILGGVVAGPVLLCGVVRVLGVMSCCFWSEVIVTGLSVWSATCSGPSKYGTFVASRVITGLFVATVQVFTTGVIAQLFYLHQRGKALAIYSTVYLIAVNAGPTFSAFIVEQVEWQVCIWWTVGANGVTALLFFLFAEDTSWDRQKNVFPAAREPPSSWFKRRVALFCPGTRVVAPGKVQKIKTSYDALWRIFFSPVVIMIGLYSMLSYAWFVMSGIQTPIILAEPAKLGGHGFSPLSTGYFYFCTWIGSILGIFYGILLNDRLPLWLQKHRGGIWHPEYRLHVIWLPGLFVTPIGVGIFGAAVYYGWHWIVLAVALAMIVFGATASVSPTVNYVIEVFKSHPQEVGAALNVYRIAFAVGVTFFYSAWVERVGVNWAFGTAGFLSVWTCMLIALIVWKGPMFRSWSLLEDEAAAQEAAAHGSAANNLEKESV